MLCKRFATMAMVLGIVATTATVVGAAPAAAADTCVGSQIRSMNTTNPANGNVIAITRAYRGGGQICVVSVKQNGYYGKLTHEELWMFKDNGNRANDIGNFYYQAGPIRMADSGCIHFELDLWNGPVPGGGVNIRQDYDYDGINC